MYKRRILVPIYSATVSYRLSIIATCICKISLIGQNPISYTSTSYHGPVSIDLGNPPTKFPFFPDSRFPLFDISFALGANRSSVSLSFYAPTRHPHCALTLCVVSMRAELYALWVDGCKLVACCPFSFFQRLCNFWSTPASDHVRGLRFSVAKVGLLSRERKSHRSLSIASSYTAPYTLASAGSRLVSVDCSTNLPGLKVSENN